MKKIFCFVLLFILINVVGCSTHHSDTKESSSNVNLSSSSKQVQNSSAPSANSSISSTLQTSTLSEADDRQIIQKVAEELINRYPDINITNEWLSAKGEFRYAVLFGSLKIDTRQGVGQVIRYNAECTEVLDEKKYLDPLKHGTVRVTDLGARDNDMLIVDADGNKRSFAANQGFDPKG